MGCCQKKKNEKLLEGNIEGGKEEIINVEENTKIDEELNDNK